MVELHLGAVVGSQSALDSQNNGELYLGTGSEDPSTTLLWTEREQTPNLNENKQIDGSQQSNGTKVRTTEVSADMIPESSNRAPRLLYKLLLKKDTLLCGYKILKHNTGPAKEVWMSTEIFQQTLL